MTGCNCLDVSWSWRRGVRKNKLNQGACNYNETSAGCLGVREVSSVNLKFSATPICGIFGNSTETLLGTIKNMNLIDGSCKPGFKKCGNVQGVSGGVCLPEDSLCPITALDFG